MKEKGGQSETLRIGPQTPQSFQAPVSHLWTNLPGHCSPWFLSQGTMVISISKCMFYQLPVSLVFLPTWYIPEGWGGSFFKLHYSRSINTLCALNSYLTPASLLAWNKLQNPLTSLTFHLILHPSQTNAWRHPESSASFLLVYGSSESIWSMQLNFPVSACCWY